jgi:hypothetical protein
MLKKVAYNTKKTIYIFIGSAMLESPELIAAQALKTLYTLDDLPPEVATALQKLDKICKERPQQASKEINNCLQLIATHTSLQSIYDSIYDTINSDGSCVLGPSRDPERTSKNSLELESVNSLRPDDSSSEKSSPNFWTKFIQKIKGISRTA